ncbi:MAG: selenide, water dikinase SelD [Armatimonadetes bacterium]|nr:selenide, water dikinase SelD [Armatimonadota bacterium]
MAEVLRHLPAQSHPDLLVGFDTRDDAGVLRLPDGRALVQTVDFFTPVVDDPYSYGQIAAANALSDVYAMGGTPISALNIACFDPEAAPAEVWAEIFRGMAEKTLESGAVLLGGHSVEDDEPKFGMAVTGLVDPDAIFANSNAKNGESIWLSKPLGTGIVTTAAKFDKCSAETLQAGIQTMSALNNIAAETSRKAGVKCGTDITGFGLLGHLGHIARESGVTIEISVSQLPLLPEIEHLVALGATTGGAIKNREMVSSMLQSEIDESDWRWHVLADPQTSGGLAVTSTTPLEGFTQIGRVVSGPAVLKIVE